MPPLIPQIGSKSIPLRRTALKKDGQDTLIYLSILLIVLATNWPGWYRLIVWLSLAVPRGVPRAPPRDDWAVEDGDSKRWWSSTHPEEPQRSAMLHDAPRCSEFLESLPHLLGLSVGALQGWQCWYRWSFQPNLLIGMIFLLLHSGNFIGSTCDNLWQLLYIAQRNSWTFGSLWEWFGQRRFDTSKMRFRSIHRLGNKSPAPTMLEAAWHFFHLLSTAKQVESRTADAALKPRHLLETIPPASAVYNMMSLTSASQCPHWILHRLDQERKDFLNGWHDPQLRHPSSSLKAKLWHIWHAAWQCLAKSEENPYRRLVKWLPAYSKSPSSKRGNFL